MSLIKTHSSVTHIINQYRLYLTVEMLYCRLYQFISASPFNMSIDNKMRNYLEHKNNVTCSIKPLDYKLF